LLVREGSKPTAGLDDLRQEDGDLERPASGDEWDAPGESLSCDGTLLVIDRRRWIESVRTVKAGPQMLEDFANLAKATSSERVLAYARHWGLLGLCQHYLPREHGEIQVPLALATAGGVSVTSLVPDDCRSLFEGEPLDVWKYYARQAYSLLGVFSRLRDSKSALVGDWEILGEFGPWTGFDTEDVELSKLAKLAISGLVSGEASVGRQQLAAAGAIRTWLQMAGVKVELRWGQSGPMVGFATGGLFGALGLQLLLAAVNSAGFVVCPECGVSHSPPRERHRPPKYCQACRDRRVPQARASANYQRQDRDNPNRPKMLRGRRVKKLAGRQGPEADEFGG
jgi:hypothetical protein